MVNRVVCYIVFFFLELFLVLEVYYLVFESGIIRLNIIGKEKFILLSEYFC